MIGVITADDAFAWCMSVTPNAADCREEVAAQLVDGVYCDGTIVMTAGQPKRCVPTGVLAAKLAAAQKTPLPAHTPQGGIETRGYWIVGGAVVGLGLLYLALR